MSTKPINAVVYHSDPFMTKPELPAPLVRLARETLGPARLVRDLSRPSSKARVFDWHGSTGRAALKVHASTRLFRQELRAYRDWLPDLDQAPALMAMQRSQPLALVLEWLPGTPLADRSLAPDQERQAWHDAGAWLRRFHALPFEDSDPLPLHEAYGRRIAVAGDATARGQRLVAWLQGVFAPNFSDLAGASRTPCHHDFEPRNWLVEAGGEWLATIDFEHARPDHPLSDLSRAAAYFWPERPDLESAFWTGYGAAPSEAERRLVRAFAALDAVQRSSWADRHGDRQLAASARRALAALGAPV